MSGVPLFNTPYLNDYLAMVEDTESPRIFHIWSAIFAMSSALGRRCWLPFGTMDIFPNHYIVLVGTPGTRKSTAANQGKRILRQSTGVRFAPRDTGGQRQGLVLALKGGDDNSKEFVGAMELGAKENSISSLTQFEDISNVAEDEEQQFIDAADKHHIAIVASEFSRLIGQNNHSMLDFLGELYDGEDVDYLTLKSNIQVKNPLLNLLACTTPISINNALPPQVSGQGFLSRIMLVYGARKYKAVPRPMPPDLDRVAKVKETLNNAYYQIAGGFEETTESRAYSEELYHYNLDINDSRFGYYNERRYTHLIKLSMCLAAARGDRVIVKDDYQEAHRILRATERGMPDALGEFGLNPQAMLKQEILEQLRANQGPLTFSQVIAMFHRDAKSSEIAEVLNDLIRVGQVKMNQLSSGEKVMSAVYTKKSTEDEMMTLLAEGR